MNIIIDINRDERTAENDQELIDYVIAEFAKMTVTVTATDGQNNAAVKTAVEGAVGTAYAAAFTGDFDVKDGSKNDEGFTSGVKTVENQAYAEGTKAEPNGKDGIYTVSYALKGKTDATVVGVASIQVTVKALPYSETTAGKAEAAALAKINAVKNAVLDADNGLKELGATAAAKDGALDQLKTDVGGIITGLGSEATGVTVKSATAEDSGFTAPADPDKGRLTATVTLACTGCDDVSFTVTITIPVN